MSLYELPLSLKKIEAIVKQVRHYDIAFYELQRFFISKKNHPVTRPLTEAVTEAHEYLSVCSDEEIESLYGSMNDGYKRLISSKLKTEEDRQRFAIYYITWRVYRSEFPFKEVVEQVFEGSEVFKIYPELVNKLDDDGLLHLDSDFTLHDGGVEYKNHILPYHQLLRRGYTSSLNFGFLGRFISYYEQLKDRNQFRIAIDYQKLILKEFYGQLLEFSTWFGPKFDLNKLDDPNYTGLTVVVRNKDLPFMASNDLDKTEVYWSFRDDIKTFEVEEISSDDYIFDDFYFNRYVHSERDVSLKEFRHLDGAIKIYLRNSFSHRKNSEMPREFKSHRKVKLWRIDGNIALDSWLNLISFFFEGNEMIIEYFDPQQYQEFVAEMLSSRDT